MLDDVLYVSRLLYKMFDENHFPRVDGLWATNVLQMYVNHPLSRIISKQRVCATIFTRANSISCQSAFVLKQSVLYIVR